jgi:NAD(P)-dependent dehydrogenase (short-subunit alcohol dehydrogenase family)
MPTVLVVGGSRGIGHEFARQYANAGWAVHATCRAPQATGENPSRISWHPLEVKDQSSIDRLARELDGQPVDLLLLCAGLMGPRDMRADAIDRATWGDIFAVNTMAPLAIAGAFQPHLARGKYRKLIALSSRLGSMAENANGSLYIYRSSKAALNAVWRSLSIDMRDSEMICTVLHPGWVRTEMGGPNGEISVEESVTGMRHLIETLTLDHSGKFFNYDGAPMPW